MIVCPNCASEKVYHVEGAVSDLGCDVCGIVFTPQDAIEA